MSVDNWKRAAAHHAAGLVKPGMVVGLGHGSTAAFAVERLAARLRQGALSDIVGVPCSTDVARAARLLGIPLTTLDEHPIVQITIDGADEVDPDMNLIKGGGGALLREKVVATASERVIIVVDGSKLSPHLGSRFALPVEVVPFACAVEARYLESLGALVVRRGGEAPFLTDGGNVILDCNFGTIESPHELAARLNARPGIVAHGLFLDLATDLIVGDDRGVRHVRRGASRTEATAQ
jgi:ribose 5-phosphate isomerase A